MNHANTRKLIARESSIGDTVGDRLEPFECAE